VALNGPFWATHNAVRGDTRQESLRERLKVVQGVPVFSLRLFLRQRMLASDRRAGKWARGRARREQYEFVRRSWRRFALLGTVPLLLPSIAAAFLPRFVGGMLLGAAITAVLGLLAFYVIQATGTAPIMAGDGAEQWTAQELRPLRQHGWRLINHFNLSNSGDVDHLLIGPSGVLAVETRWSARPWDYDDATDSRLAEKILQARKAARRLELWQPFHGRRIPVRPVVMLWGRGLSDWPVDEHGFAVDDVQVVAGPRAMLWRRSLSQQAVLTDVQVAEVWAAIDRQVERRDEYDRSAWPVPPSPFTLYMRGLIVLTAFTAGLLIAGALLQPLSWAGFAGCAVLLVIGGLALRHRATKFAGMGWLVGVTALLLTAGVALLLARLGPL
jgi:hypothetical protein